MATNQEPGSGPTTGRMTLDMAMAQAIRLHQTRQLDAAERLYRRILEIAPGHPGALHFLGLACHQRGRSEEGIALMSQAIRAEPDQPGFHNNLGNVLAESGKLDEAATAFQRVLVLQPRSADTYNNLGVLNKMRQRFEEAETCYRRALDLDPGNATALSNLGVLRTTQGRLEEAVTSYRESIRVKPDNPRARGLLGLAYYALGRTAEAAEVFRHWLELEPNQPMAKHMYAACSGERPPERAADDYLEQLFDSFACSFEEQLQSRLAYRAPGLVIEAVARHSSPPARQYDVLDAGCGTGLCGLRIRPWARTLDGVDLSGGMLAKAHEKGCYTALHKAELTAYLGAHPASYDLIICVDTLEYFGKLEGVMQAAAHALRPAAWFVFTVEDAAESSPPEGFRLNPHGRYAHTRGYLESVLHTCQLRLTECTPAVLRTEFGKPVNGLVVVARKPGEPPPAALHPE